MKSGNNNISPNRQHNNRGKTHGYNTTMELHESNYNEKYNNNLVIPSRINSLLNSGRNMAIQQDLAERVVSTMYIDSLVLLVY